MQQNKSNGLQSGLGRRSLMLCTMLVVLLASILGSGLVSVASAAGELEIATTKISNAIAGTPYRHVLAAQGGTPAYVWSVTSGVLPVGITFNTATGEFSGTAETTTTAPLTIQVTDGAGGVASKPLELIVDPMPIFEVSRQPLTSAQIPYPKEYGFSFRYNTSNNSNELTKYDASGAPLWTKSDAAYASFFMVSVDYNNSLVYMANVQGAIIKLDIEGNIIDSFTVATGHGGNLYTMVAAGDGSLYLAFSYIDISGNIFIMKVDASGTVLWSALNDKKSQYLTNGGSVTATDMVVDSKGNLYVQGGTTSPFPFMSWLLKYAANGTPIFDQISNTYSNYNESLAIDNNDTLFQAGKHWRAYPPGQGQGYYSHRVRILNSDGMTLWDDPGGYGPNHFNSARDIHVANDEFYVTMEDYPNSVVKYRLNFHILQESLSQSDPGLPYSQSLTALGGVAPYSWSVQTGVLPDGLTLDSTTGIITGIPTTIGTYPMTFQAIDAKGAMALKCLSILVAGPPSITTSIDDLAVSNYYEIIVTAAGGHPPFTWSVSNGELPPGMVIDTDTIGRTWFFGSPTTPGSYTFTLQLTDVIGATASRTYTVSVKTQADISLENLNQTYDGTPKAVTATTNPAGLAVTVTYNGSSTLPTTSGDYAVAATINDPNYMSTASGTLNIAKAAATIILGDLNQTYDGTLKTVTATTIPAGLVVDITYNGSATVPTAVGDYAVVATINDPNYQGSVSGNLNIAKAAATITLGNLSQTYDGTPKLVTATTTPTGLAVDITYDGSATVPTAAGDYAVVATINDPNYQGSVSGNLNIAKAAATITLGNLSQTYDGTPKLVTATTTPAGLAVDITYNGSATVPATAGDYAIVATINDFNYQGSASGAMNVAKAVATITLGNLSQTYDGTPRAASAMTNPAGLAVTFTYDGSSTAPTNVGSYAVAATINDPNYQGSASDTLNVAKAEATIALGDLSQTYDGTPKAASAMTNPAGLAVTFTYDGIAIAPTSVGSYSVVATINDSNYQGSASSSLNIGKANQMINFNPPANKTFGDPAFDLSVYVIGGASGNPVTFTVTSGPGTLNGSVLTITGAGNIVITASQAGNANYYPAPDVQATIAVAKKTQTINFNPPATALKKNTIDLSMYATGGGSVNPVTFTVTSGSGVIVGTNLSFPSTGIVVVTASQLGDNNYNAAADVQGTIVVTTH